MEVGAYSESNEHVIDIDGRSHTLYDPLHGLNRAHADDDDDDYDDVQSPTSNDSNSRNPWIHIKCNLYISICLVFTLAQLIAAVVVLSVSEDAKPPKDLAGWIVVYVLLCLATLPHLYWLYRNQLLTPSTNIRLLGPVALSALALFICFSSWFIVGIFSIIRGNVSSSESPNLYWLFIVFLTISGIWFVILIILSAMIRFRHPCIVSIADALDHMIIAQEGIAQEGASEESINALPTHKIKLKTGNSSDGGFVVKGTAKKHAISGEDAVCCICITKYVDGDELRELPCSHFFHTECVDRWLRINASCPLCKNGIGAHHHHSHSSPDPTPLLS